MDKLLIQNKAYLNIIIYYYKPHTSIYLKIYILLDILLSKIYYKHINYKDISYNTFFILSIQILYLFNYDNILYIHFIIPNAKIKKDNNQYNNFQLKSSNNKIYIKFCLSKFCKASNIFNIAFIKFAYNIILDML